MKIKKIHIISFGGLKDFTLDFTHGLNCIYGENEHGKSTVMAFIKMMFYGSERGSSQLSKNIRKKYTPWDGSAMLGSIEFEYSGKAYRIEREFRSSNSTDKVTLTDLNLGTKENVAGDIGTQLFGLTAAAFERSIFIGQLGFPQSDSAAESEINARLSNLASTGDEMISLEEVTKRIEKARFALISKSGKTGEYIKLSDNVKSLSQRLSAALDANKRYLSDKEKLIAFNLETAKFSKKAKALKEQLSKEEDIKSLGKLKEYVSAKEDLEKLKGISLLNDGTEIDEGFISKLEFCHNKATCSAGRLESKQREIKIAQDALNTALNPVSVTGAATPEDLQQALDTERANLKETEEQIIRNKNKLNTLNSDLTQGNCKKAFNPLFLILGILGLALSPVLFMLIGIMGCLASAVLGLGLLILSLVLKPNDIKKAQFLKGEISSIESILKNLESAKESTANRIGDLASTLKAIQLTANERITLIEAHRKKLSDLETELEDLNTAYRKDSEELEGFLNKLDSEDSQSISGAIKKFKANYQMQKDLKRDIKRLIDDLGGITYEQASTKLRELADKNLEVSKDFTQLKEEYNTLQEMINERKEKSAYAQSDLKNIISGAESPEILQAELEAKNDLMEQQKAFCDTADIALEVLKESFAQLRSNYGSQLEKQAGKIFSQLTDGKYTDLTVSKSFEMNVTPRGDLSKEAEYLSSGAFDQAYLSLRLAIAGLMCENEELPIFLDDSLTQYDDTRAKITLEFLKDYTKSSQAIMFTCHKTLAAIVKDLNCNTIDM